MLKDEDRIFKNLYNDLGADLISSKKIGDLRFETLSEMWNGKKRKNVM